MTTNDDEFNFKLLYLTMVDTGLTILMCLVAYITITILRMVSGDYSAMVMGTIESVLFPITLATVMIVMTSIVLDKERVTVKGGIK